MNSVSGKVAFITGGAGAIGFAMMEKLLINNAKGVAVVDLSEEAGNRALVEITKVFGREKVIFIKTDVTIKEELERAFEETINHFNQLDIVINNAGIVDELDWKKTVAGGVIEGTLLAMQKYLPQFKSENEGVIINTASVLGLVPFQSAPFYAISKHGLIGLGLSFGGDEYYKMFKVRVLTLCPGLVKTSLSEVKNHNVGLLPTEKRLEEVFKVNSIAQSPERVGEALIKIIENGRNGSLWVIEDDKEVYEIQIPYYRSLKVEK